MQGKSEIVPVGGVCFAVAIAGMMDFVAMKMPGMCCCWCDCSGSVFVVVAIVVVVVLLLIVFVFV